MVADPGRPLHMHPVACADSFWGLLNFCVCRVSSRRTGIAAFASVRAASYPAAARFETSIRFDPWASRRSCIKVVASSYINCVRI